MYIYICLYTCVYTCIYNDFSVVSCIKKSAQCLLASDQVNKAV